MKKESEIKAFLLKESINKLEFEKNAKIHNILLAQTEEAKPMARQSGGTALKNSSWNTDWEFTNPEPDINRVYNQVYNNAVKFFTGLSHGVSGDLRPSPISFKFKYFRTIMPDNDKEANAKAVKALDVLDKYLPGFKQFVQDLQRLKIPLCPYFITVNPNSDLGRVDSEQVANYVKQQSSSRLSLPDGRAINTGSHFAPHKHLLQNGEDITISTSRNTDRIYPMKAVDEITDPTLLTKAIEHRISSGYTMNKMAFENLRKSLSALYQKKLEQYKLDWKNPAHKKDLEELHHIFQQDFWNRIIQWWQAGRIADLPAYLLREILKNLVPTSGQSQNSFTIPGQRSVYHSNGWDSSPGSDQPMLVMPPIKSLPATNSGPGEVRGDRGNGNLSYDHLVLNWKNGLDQIFLKYGAKAEEWLKVLSSGQQMGEIARISPEVFAAWQLILSSNYGSRTGAENLLEILARWPNWQQFNSNHLQKSFFSELSTVSELSKIPITKLTSFNGQSPLAQQIAKHGERILGIAQSDPVKASQLLKYLSAELVFIYKSNKISWDNLTLALSALNRVVLQNKYIESNGIKALGKAEKSKAIDEIGFESLKKYGYQIAKLMDFVHAVMIRCCHEVITTHKDGIQEHQFGHNYGTSSGVSGGGEVVLSMTYNKLEASLSNQAIQINESIIFQLGQRTGDINEPIISRQSSSWERMMDLFSSMYPEAGYQFQEMNEPVHRGLQSLELKIKEAVMKANNSGLPIIYHNTEGETFTLTPQDIAIEKQFADEEPTTPESPTSKEPQIQPTTPGLDQNVQWTANPPPDEVENSIMEPMTPSIPQTEKAMLKTPVMAPESPLLFLQKRKNNDRKLFRENPNRNKLPTPLSSIEERLIKAANIFDNYGKQDIADKIDFLLKMLKE